MAMNTTQEIRRSGRRRIRPLEHWNFEKPEDSVNVPITYNYAELSRCSVFMPYSNSYIVTPRKVLTSGKNIETTKRTEKKGNHLSLTPKPLGQKQKLKEDTKRNGKLSKKTTHQTPTKKGQSEPPRASQEKTDSSKLDKNKNLTGKDYFTQMNGDTTLQPAKRTGNKGISEENSSLNSNNLTVQKKRGKKRVRESEEPQESDGTNTSVLQGVDSRSKVPHTPIEENANEANQQKSSRIRLTANSLSEHPTSSLSNSREQHTRSIQQATLTTGRDVTQNTTAYEQPSFQNVFSSTPLTAGGVAVFKMPRLPPIRRPTLPALKMSSLSVDPSMVTIPEEEEEKEEEEGQHHQKKKKQEKEDLVKDRKKEKDKPQQQEQMMNGHVNEAEENEGEEQEENGEEQRQEEQEQKKQKMKISKKKTSLKGKDKSMVDDSGVSSECEDVTIIAAPSSAKTGASQRELPQERDSSAVPSKPQGQESRIHPFQEDTRAEVSQGCRRSTRVRMKPLEYWNFEKVEVERQADGEVHIIHQKQDPVNMSIKSRVVDCSMAFRSQLGHGISLTTDLLGEITQAPKPVSKAKKTSVKHKISPIKSMKDNTGQHPALTQKKRVDAEQIMSSWTPDRTPSKSPSKRKLFSPGDNFLDEPVEGSTFRKRTKGGVMLVHIKKFKNLPFMVIEREAYKCYLAQGLQIKDQSIYTGYVFLEWGQIVWNTTRKTTIYVIEGIGRLKCISEDSGSAYSLKPRDTVEFNRRVKLSMKKDGRCKMLKLHVVLGPHLK